MESETKVRQETSAEIVSWLKFVRSYAPVWSHVDEPFIDSSVRLFDPEILRAKSYVVVPLFHVWYNLSKPSFQELQAQDFGRLYIAGFDDEINDDKFFSCPPIYKQMRSAMLDFIDLCIVTSRREDFLILQSYCDYWLLAGKPDLIAKLLRQPLDLTFRDFYNDVFGSPGCFEAGRVFAKDIIEKYTKHNTRVLDQ